MVIAKIGRSKRKWFAKFLDLTNGIPSHDRFNAILPAIKPYEFENCLLSWITALHDISDGQIIVIDGKTRRRSFDKASSQDPRRKKLPHLTKSTKVDSLVLLLINRKADRGKPKKTAFCFGFPLSAFHFRLSAFERDICGGPMSQTGGSVKTRLWANSTLENKVFFEPTEGFDRTSCL